MFKSKEELYFSYYLEELQENGFINFWRYESDTYTLSPKLEMPYEKRMKTKVKTEYEFLLHPSSITADFTIQWNDKAANIFYLDRYAPIKSVKAIPFRLNKLGSDCSLIEVKGAHTFKTNTSDISFPYKQKFLFEKYKIYIQKIKPFDTNVNKNTLFQSTFTPKKVIDSEKYVKNTAKNKIGDTKLKYSPITLQEFVNLRMKENE